MNCVLLPSRPCTADANGQCACECPQPVGFWTAMVDAFHAEHHQPENVTTHPNKEAT